VHIDLGGEIALVTASTAGIGLATAKGLAAAGAMVIVNGRTQGRVERAMKAVGAGAPGAKVVGIVAGAGNANGCDALVTQHPYCDILVNNLGIYAEQDFFALPDSEWLRFLEVNVMSGVRLSRAYLPGMIARGWGRIVFISSESALNVPADMIHYAVTKTAQLSVARGLAKRLGGTGVTVNSILPGPTLTEEKFRDNRWKMPLRHLSRRIGRRQSFRGWPAQTKSPIWSFMRARHRHPPPQGPLCAWMAACSIPSPEE